MTGWVVSLTLIIMAAEVESAAAKPFSEAPPASIGVLAQRTGPSAPPPKEPPASNEPSPEPAAVPRAANGGTGFEVNEFIVEGNTLLPDERVQALLNAHKGPGKSIQDIDKARQAVEKAYHESGFPTVIVMVPEQTVESGTVRLSVIEGKVGQVTVTDNRYYSRFNILRKLPSIKIGEVLREKDLVKELDVLNANPDLKVAPVLKPGAEQGLVNVELKTKDRFPGHIRIQGDNQGPLTTPSNRLLIEAQMTNLFDADHILNLQTIQTPTDWGAVQTYGASYVAPLKWPDHLLSVYASKTISTSSLAASSLGVGGGGSVVIGGNATVAGLRYIFPLASGPEGTHQLLFGADYKRLEETSAEFPAGLGSAVVLSPVQYTPASLGYNGLIIDQQGLTKLSATVKGYRAGLIPGGKRVNFEGDPNDPFNKPGRAGATGNFVVTQGSLGRTQFLPFGFTLNLQADGQWANEPLVVTEQYFAGGLDTVRGYAQFEALGDNAVRGRAELTTPDLLPIPIDMIWQRRRSAEWNLNWKLAVFYDATNLWVQNALPGQRDQFRLEGVGAGLRVKLPKDVGDLRIDQAWALKDGTVTKRGDSFVHFLVSVGY